MRTTIFLLLLFSFFIPTDSCFAQVYTRTWVNTYGNDSVPYDFAPVQMCVTKSGNVYVVSNKDTAGFINMIVVTRYDDLGNIIWERVYVSPSGNDATATSIACDLNENIIVAGTEFVPNNSNDYLVIKYDSAGNFKWSFNYNGVGNDVDIVNAMQPDSLGNIYVTGTSGITGDPSFNTDALTCKIDSSGNLVWFSYYSYPVTTSVYDNASFLKINTSGEIIIAGTLSSINRICKYDTSGNLLWTGDPATFEISGMTLDDSANCYVFNSIATQDVPLVKYDSSGSILFNKSIYFQHGGGLSDILINDNFLYASGYATFDTALKADFLLVKYSLNGDTIWSRHFNNTANLPDLGDKILCDSSNNLFVLGRTSNSGNDYDILTLKYDSSGNYQWKYQLLDTTVSEYLTDAKLDSSGNILISANTNYYNFYFEVAKVSNAGSLQWIEQRDNYQEGTDFGIKIVRDRAGDLITAGTSISKTLGMDIVLIKYNTAGNQQWMTRMNFTLHNSMVVYELMSDEAGNIYLCGAIDSSGSPDGNHALTAKFDASGNMIWYSVSNSLFDAVSFALDSSQNLYVLGNIRLAQYRHDAALLKYDSNGYLLWEKMIADSTVPAGQHILFDGFEHFFISLTQVNIPGHSQDLTVMKIDTACNKIWRRDFNGPVSQVDYNQQLLLDHQLNPVLVGFSDSLDYDIVVVKYDSSGNYLWNYRYAGPGNNWDQPKDAALDEFDNIYVTGSIYDANYIPECITFKVDPLGNMVWDAVYNGNGVTPYNVGNAIAVSDSGRVLVTGTTYNTNILVLAYDTLGNEIFLDTSLMSAYYFGDLRSDIVTGENETFYVTSSLYTFPTMTDIVTIKYADIILKTKEFSNSSNGLTAFPNPFGSRLTLSCFSDKDIIATLEVMNPSGIKLSEKEIRLQRGKNQFELDASLLGAGLYMVMLKKSDGELLTRQVISIK